MPKLIATLRRLAEGHSVKPREITVIGDDGEALAAVASYMSEGNFFEKGARVVDDEGVELWPNPPEPVLSDAAEAAQAAQAAAEAADAAAAIVAAKEAEEAAAEPPLPVVVAGDDDKPRGKGPRKPLQHSR